MRFERVSLVRARSADLIRAGGPGDRPGHMHAAGPASKHYQFPCIAEAIHTCRSRSGKRGSPSARHRRRIGEQGIAPMTVLRPAPERFSSLPR
jgi:hypothetical protein